VVSITPEVGGITVEVVGGDSFLRVVVEPGHEVLIPGYEGEPYLRILADGTVEENQRSPATYLNQDRYGQVDVSGVDADAEPEWLVIDDDGEIAWHDHRIHWMSPEVGAGVEAGDETPNSPWEVPMTVDGVDVVVSGTLVYVGGISPLPWVGLGLAAGALLVVVGWPRRRSLTVATAGALVGSVAASIAGAAEWSSQPDGTGASSAVLIVPVVGLVAAVAAGVLLLVRRPALASVGVLAAAAAMLGWGVLRFDVLTHPVLPTDLPAGLDRTLTVLALGLGVAAAVLAVHSGSLAVPEARLVDDPSEAPEDGAAGAPGLAPS
jgi:hypothetical protein